MTNGINNSNHNKANCIRNHIHTHVVGFWQIVMQYIVFEAYKFVYNNVKYHPDLGYLPVRIWLPQLIFDKMKDVYDTYFNGNKLKDKYKYMIDEDYNNMSVIKTKYKDDQDVLNKLTVATVNAILCSYAT